jgi:hypothetical protein
VLPGRDGRGGEERQPRRGVHDRADAHLLLRVHRRREVDDRLAGLEADADSEWDLGGRA